MEQFSLQLENKTVPFSLGNERSTKKNTHIQASSLNTQIQLDWLETQSTTTPRNVGRNEGRGRKKVVG